MINDDFSASLAAKSVQINALDLAADTLFKIVGATYDPKKEQPMDIFVEGYKLPWKPSLGMRRIMSQVWGTKCSGLVGKQLIVYCNKDVRFGPDKTGGIQIKAMQDLQEKGYDTILRVGKKSTPYHVDQYEPQIAYYPQDQFEQALPQMVAAMQNGWTLDQVFAECKNVGELTQDQVNAIKEKAPL